MAKSTSNLFGLILVVAGFIFRGAARSYPFAESKLGLTGRLPGSARSFPRSAEQVLQSAERTSRTAGRLPRAFWWLSWGAWWRWSFQSLGLAVS
jgi:hypothetical protein